MRVVITADPEIEVPPRLYGGIERVVDGLVRRFRARGHQVCLVAKPGSACPADAFYPWPGASSLSAYDSLRNAWALWKAVRAFRPDVIQSFSRIAYLTPLLRAGTPIVMSYQRDPTMRTVGLAMKLAAPGVLRFTGCSEYIAGLGRQAGGEWSGIPNFAEMDALKFSPTVARDAPLVFLSRVESIKGAHWAIEIARRTGQRLIIAGNHSDAGSEGDYWRREIEPQIGHGGIEYVGPVDDAQKNKLLGEARAMVVPIQWNEPFGIVFAEALACGTPVVSCPRGSLTEIVRPGVDGFLIKSVEEGCEAVARLDTIDRANCRRRAEEAYAPDVIVERYLDLYARAGGAGFAVTRRVALVSGHFAPSNLVGAHRARLWSRYLPEFGWEPIVVTGDPAFYEERPDPDLARLVAPGLRVIHAPTISTRPIRLVGDVGVRAFRGCYKALAGLAQRREIDFVLVTIPSNFLAPIGRLVHMRYGLPFGIDYQDPWVNRWPGVDRPFTRAWGSYRLANLLEPWAVRGAALITGMAPGYVAGMLERNTAVAKDAVIAYMPMGSAAEDFELVRTLHRPSFLFQSDDGLFHMIYAGALLPAGVVVLDAFLAGLQALRQTAPLAAARLRVHFVGTGSSPDDPLGHRVLPRAVQAGVGDMVSEHPHRIGYVDTLNHLEHSDAVLVLGSTERHYTPSKVFQAILSKRPVFAMLHAESTAIDMVAKARAGRVLTLTERTMPAPGVIAVELQALMEGTYDASAVDAAGFEAYSARELTRALAAALDLACERQRTTQPSTGAPT